MVFVAGRNPATERRLVNLLRSVGLQMLRVESPRTLIAEANPTAPGCLLFDPTAAGGTDWIGQTQLAGRQLPCLGLASRPSIASVVQAMRAGAWSYVAESASDQELLDEIQGAVQEDACCLSAAASTVVWQSKFGLLTAREREVLQQTIEGFSSKEIGRRLDISSRTVDAHRGNIVRKLGISRLSEAVRPFCLWRQGNFQFRTHARTAVQRLPGEHLENRSMAAAARNARRSPCS